MESMWMKIWKKSVTFSYMAYASERPVFTGKTANIFFERKLICQEVKVKEIELKVFLYENRNYH